MSAAVSNYLYDKERSAKSKRWYEQKLRAFEVWSSKHICTTHATPTLDIGDVDAHLIREFLAYIRDTPSTAINHIGQPPGGQTLHGYARVLKAFLRWCALDDLVPRR